MRAQLKDPKHCRGITTVYLPNISSKREESGNYAASQPVTFFRGKGSVDGQVHQHLKDKGLV